MVNCSHWQGKKPWKGDDAKCAFLPVGKMFYKENWNCKLMCDIREILETKMYDSIAWSADQKCVVVPVNSESGTFAIIGWYKSRGKTEMFKITDGDTFIRTGTEAEAIELLFTLNEMNKLNQFDIDRFSKKIKKNATKRFIGA